MKSNFLVIAVLIVLIACDSTQERSPGIGQTEPFQDSIEIVLKSEVKWGSLNPARGRKSPKAGNLWGDRKGSGASGFLVEFVDGFSSPPHIHNVTYKGIVITGKIHNDDPEAKNMWMSTGSFWTQPAGEVRITSAQGDVNLVYVEINEGPYLVKPTEESFTNGELPVNLDESNLVWVNGNDLSWINTVNHSISIPPRAAFLWGNPEQGELNGTLIEIPPGFNGKLISNTKGIRMIVIEGQSKVQTNGEEKVLETGSYIGSKGKVSIDLANSRNAKCLIYIRSVGNFSINH